MGGKQLGFGDCELPGVNYVGGAPDQPHSSQPMAICSQ